LLNKDKIEIMDIELNKLQELFTACGGRLSHYVFLSDEPQEYINLLLKEKYIKVVTEGDNKTMYICTKKLIEVFRPLNEHEDAQVKADDRAKAEERLADAQELTNMQEQIQQ